MFVFWFILQKVLKGSVANCLVDKTTEAVADHVGIWDRPKRATGTNGAAGGAYMIDPQNHVVLARNIKVKSISSLGAEATPVPSFISYYLVLLIFRKWRSSRNI